MEKQENTKRESPIRGSTTPGELWQKRSDAELGERVKSWKEDLLNWKAA